MAAPILLRALPLLHRRLAQHHNRRLAQHHNRHIRLTNASISLRNFCSGAAAATDSSGSQSPKLSQIFTSKPVKDPPRYSILDDPDFRKRRDKEAEILEDIDPIILLTKEILHSDRYMDGERLTPDDEKVVVDKLLAHHPHSEDKIGCGLDSIMVDRHPQFKHSRCLFVVRTDGGWIDFSYQKCLRAYIRDKYHSHADKFIKSHYKRGSS